MLQINPDKRLSAIDTLSNVWLTQEEAQDNEIADNSAKNMARFGLIYFLVSLKID